MNEKKCSFCGSTRYEERKIDYLYQYQGEYLLVPDTPVEVCLDCGMIYYAAKVLKEIEEHFLAIKAKTEQPDRYIEMPSKEFTSMLAA